MDAQQKKILIAGVLLVGMVLLLYYQFSKPVVPEGATTQPGGTAAETTPSAPGEPAEQTAAIKMPVKVDRKELLASIDRGNFVYDYSNLRDPMTPVMYGGTSLAGGGTEEAIAVSRLHMLEGIVWSPDNPLASIDGVVVGIGERLADGAVVKEILRDTVILNTDTGTFSVGFYEE